ncbi:hypothetical protein [Ruminococcus sp. Marseille-P6503]|uniref:hypothetical protein n=1 Tax=Ruminococcus sp. Marseille-P6503 TaxID=2364796 RepID=UPI000F5204C9|nr:hypothetical protein [Ruminococcus sp. Marseille-P6503]
MRDVLSNVWVKRCVSIFNVAYFAVIVLLTYATFLYKLEFAEGMQASFFAIYAFASLVFLVLMLYTRKQPITKLLSIVMLPVVFFMILFNMGLWVLIIPPFIVAVVMFFASGNNETVKVIMGTIYLLLYVLGLVAYFVLNMLFGGSSVETVLDMDIDTTGSVYSRYSDQVEKLVAVTDENNTISPDGKYKFYLVDVQDSDKGAVKIYVEPYGEDIKLKFFTLKQKGIRKTITNKGTRGVIPDVGWSVKTTDSGKKELVVQYRLSEGSELKETSVSNMPKKQYLEFLGIS